MVSRRIQAAQEGAARVSGEAVPGAVLHKPPDVCAIHGRLKLTQPAFAQRFGLPVGTVRDWEQGRAVPDRRRSCCCGSSSASPRLCGGQSPAEDVTTRAIGVKAEQRG
jgi:hypothetical protein